MKMNIIPSKSVIVKQLKQHRANIIKVHNNHMKKLDETIQHLEKDIAVDKPEQNNNLTNTVEYSLDDEV